MAVEGIVGSDIPLVAILSVWETSRIWVLVGGGLVGEVTGWLKLVGVGLIWLKFGLLGELREDLNECRMGMYASENSIRARGGVVILVCTVRSH